MAVQRYEFLFHSKKIKFISSNCCVIFCSLYCIVVNNLRPKSVTLIFRSIMLKTWLYFNQLHMLFKLKEYLYIILVFSCSISIFFYTNT